MPAAGGGYSHGRGQTVAVDSEVQGACRRSFQGPPVETPATTGQVGGIVPVDTENLLWELGKVVKTWEPVLTAKLRQALKQADLKTTHSHV